MERLAIVARLKPGTEELAGAIIAQGPPFDPAEHGFDRLAVYLTATEVVFFFEAPEVEWLISEIVDSPFEWMFQERKAEWQPLLDAPPRIAREAYAWDRRPGSAPGSGASR